MKRLFGVLLIPLLCLLCLGGCDDDDDNPVCDTDQVTDLIIGEVFLRPYIDFYGHIHPIFGQENDIDSITIGDSLCAIEKSPSWVEGNNYTYGFGYNNRADSTRFRSGDTITIQIFKGVEIATVLLKAVEINVDSTIFVSPAQSDTFDLAEDITITWQTSPNADWYSVYYWHDTSNAFEASTRHVTDYTTDTTYVLPGADHPMDSWYRVFVIANSGPVPGSPGNIYSQTITGSIYGCAGPGVRVGLNVVIGDGLPIPR